jgi:hypothetical protein
MVVLSLTYHPGAYLDQMGVWQRCILLDSKFPSSTCAFRERASIPVLARLQVSGEGTALTCRSLRSSYLCHYLDAFRSTFDICLCQVFIVDNLGGTDTLLSQQPGSLSHSTPQAMADPIHFKSSEVVKDLPLQSLFTSMTQVSLHADPGT